MSIKFIIFLLVGTVLMSLPISRMGRRAELPLWKSAAIAVILTVVGTLGTMLMHFVENGTFGGISFFGAVFVVPMVFPLVAVLLRVPCGLLMDMCAVGECVMLALMKVHCYIGGCCIGRILFTNEVGDVRFPSRLAEMTVAIIIFIVLYRWFIKSQKSGRLYAWYLIIYGCLRFCLNWMRDIPTPIRTILPVGNIWSLVAIVIGFVWLLIAANIKVNKQYKEMLHSTADVE